MTTVPIKHTNTTATANTIIRRRSRRAWRNADRPVAAPTGEDLAGGCEASSTVVAVASTSAVRTLISS